MTKPTEDAIHAAVESHLQPSEQALQVAYGVKQPNILLIIGLVALAVLPGIIAITLLTKHYFVALTDQRLLVLEIKGTRKHTVKSVVEYAREEIDDAQVDTSKGMIFTKIKLDDDEKPLKVKFHRSASETNREQSIAIANALSSEQQRLEA